MVEGNPFSEQTSDDFEVSDLVGIINKDMWKDILLDQNIKEPVTRVDTDRIVGLVEFGKSRLYSVRLNNKQTPDYIVKVFENKKVGSKEDYAYNKFKKTGLPVADYITSKDIEGNRMIIVLKPLFGPSKEAPTMDMEISFLNRTINYLKEQKYQGFFETDEVKREAQLLKLLSGYEIELMLRTIAEVNAKTNVPDFIRHKSMVRTPYSDHNFFGKKLEKSKLKPLFLERQDYLNNIFKCISGMVARNYVLRGRKVEEVLKNLDGGNSSFISKSKARKLEDLLSPVLEPFTKDYSDRVIDGGDNYLHHFSRVEFKSPEGEGYSEKAFIFDFDRVQLRKRAVGVAQLLCSPLLDLGAGDIINYAKKYYDFYKQAEKEFNDDIESKLKDAGTAGEKGCQEKNLQKRECMQTKEQFIDEVIRIGIYEAAFHGPSLGAVHELYNKASYEHLIKRTKHVDLLQFKHVNDIPLKEYKDVDFKYDFYDNNNIIPKYQHTAHILADIIIGNKIKNVVNYPNEDRKKVRELIKELDKRSFYVGKKLKFFNK